jgi:hypothetical protein
MAKIRNHRKKEWVFWPNTAEAEFYPKRRYRFRYKSELMRFLNSTFPHCLNCEVTYEESSFAGIYTRRHYQVWFNSRSFYTNQNAKPEAVLKMVPFRGKKEVKLKTSKSEKKYRAFSDKVISLMSRMEKNRTEGDAKKLLELFEKRGFKDFTPNEEEQEYITAHIEKGVQYWYWSDRCNWLRTKTVIESLKKEGLLK